MPERTRSPRFLLVFPTRGRETYVQLPPSFAYTPRAAEREGGGGGRVWGGVEGYNRHDPYHAIELYDTHVWPLTPRRRNGGIRRAFRLPAKLLRFTRNDTKLLVPTLCLAAYKKHANQPGTAMGSFWASPGRPKYDIFSAFGGGGGGWGGHDKRLNAILVGHLAFANGATCRRGRDAGLGFV